MKKLYLLIFVLLAHLFYSQGDAGTSFPVCGNSTIIYTPSGFGTQELSGNTCGVYEVNSIWVKFTTATAGTIGFSIQPENNVDYDFYLFGPNAAPGALGSTIRCSIDVPPGPFGYATGCNASSTDTFEGVSSPIPAGSGVQDGFVKEITVTPNQTYYLNINRWSGTGGFTLTWTGTATLQDPFSSATNVFVNPTPIKVCASNYPYNFQNLTPTILNGNTGFNITYHYNANDASTGNNPITNIININPGQKYYYRITVVNSTIGCFKTGIMDIASGLFNVNNPTLKTCKVNGQGTFNLTTANVSSELNPTMTYYPTLADAQNGTNPITNPTAYVSAGGEVYVKIVNQLNCINYAKITLDFYANPVVADATLKVCKVGNTGTFNLTLANVTTETPVTKKYYPTLLDAQNGTNEITNPAAYVSAGGDVYVKVTNGNTCSAYAKITLDFYAAPVVTNTELKACNVNGQGTWNLTTAVVTSETGTTVKYYPTLLDAQNGTNEITTATTYTAAPGKVYARVVNAQGCFSVAEITLSLFALPNLNIAAYNATHCDNNLDGIIEIDFSTVTPVILTNNNLFTVKYYLNQADAVAGNTNTLPNNWTYNTDTTVYVRVESPNACAPVITSINFKIGAKVPVNNTTATQDVCDDNLDGVKTVTLTDYNALFTADTGVTVKYYNSLANAQQDLNPITAPVSITNTQTFYLRLTKAGVCPNTATFIINIKKAKASTVLKDKAICEGATAVLDAGTGFTSYLWSNGATTQTTTLPIGNHWVDLGFNGCVYRQNFVVTKAIDPVITAIDIQGSTVTITATGGTQPYQYSLNGITYQSSNVFTNVSRGVHTAYVKSADNCDPVTEKFSIINLLNVITPNGDGINDVLDYSDLLYKDNVRLVIFDRYGKFVFRSKDKNSYVWDGTTSNGENVPTSTYWYVLEWNEPGTNAPVKHSGWIVVKSR